MQAECVATAAAAPSAAYRPFVRAERIEDPAAYYHVATRGNDGRRIYGDDYDRRTFLVLLDRVALRYRWEILAFCLMTNHYHLLLRIPEHGLSRGMQMLNGGYAQMTNARYRTRDHVFGRRFFSATTDDDGHLLEAARYVVLNPVRAQLVDQPDAWPWSSYRCAVGLELAPRFVRNDQLLELFGTAPEPAREAYRRFVRDGLGWTRAPSWMSGNT
jgi:REP element-mobilizing transposase RayT